MDIKKLINVENLKDNFKETCYEFIKRFDEKYVQFNLKENILKVTQLYSNSYSTRHVLDFGYCVQNNKIKVFARLQLEEGNYYINHKISYYELAEDNYGQFIQLNSSRNRNIINSERIECTENNYKKIFDVLINDVFDRINANKVCDFKLLAE